MSEDVTVSVNEVLENITVTVSGSDPAEDVTVNVSEQIESISVSVASAPDYASNSAITVSALGGLPATELSVGSIVYVKEVSTGAGYSTGKAFYLTTIGNSGLSITSAASKGNGVKWILANDGLGSVYTSAKKVWVAEDALDSRKVNVEDFGAIRNTNTADAATANLAAFNAARDYIYEHFDQGFIYFPSAYYRFDNTLTFDMTRAIPDAEGTRFDFRNLSDSYGFECKADQNGSNGYNTFLGGKSNQYSHYMPWRTGYIQGPGSSTAGKSGVYWNSPTVGALDLSTRVHMFMGHIEGWEAGIRVKDRTFLCSINSFIIRGNKWGIFDESGAVNAGENMRAVNTTFGGSTINVVSYGAGWNFFGCSFDYSDQAIVGAGTFNIFGGHVELTSGSDSTLPWFDIGGQDFTNPSFDDTDWTLDTVADTLTFSSAHGLSTGQHLTYRTDGTPYGGLTDDEVYRVNVVSSTVIKLQNWRTQTDIDITSTGSGTHELYVAISSSRSELIAVGTRLESQAARSHWVKSRTPQCIVDLRACSAKTTGHFTVSCHTGPGYFMRPRGTWEPNQGFGSGAVFDDNPNGNDFPYDLSTVTNGEKLDLTQLTNGDGVRIDAQTWMTTAQGIIQTQVTKQLDGSDHVIRLFKRNTSNNGVMTLLVPKPDWAVEAVLQCQMDSTNCTGNLFTQSRAVFVDGFDADGAVIIRREAVNNAQGSTNTASESFQNQYGTISMSTSQSLVSERLPTWANYIAFEFDFKFVDTVDETTDPGISKEWGFPEGDIVTDTITTLTDHGLTNDDPYLYQTVAGTPYGGLVNGQLIYAGVLSATEFQFLDAPGGNVIDLTAHGINRHKVVSFVPDSGVYPILLKDFKVFFV